MLRTMRRCAFLFPELAEKIAKFAYHFDEKIVYGPGGAMKKYLAKIGWHFATYNVLQGHQINILSDSPKEIQKTMHSAWDYYVRQQIQERKGIGQHELDLNLTAKVYGSLLQYNKTFWRSIWLEASKQEQSKPFGPKIAMVLVLSASNQMEDTIDSLNANVLKTFVKLTKMPFTFDYKKGRLDLLTYC